MTENAHAVAVALRNAAQQLIDEDPVRDVERTVDNLVRSAVAVVPNAIAAGVSRLQGSEVLSSHATNEVVRKLDALQTDLQQGPCITAAEDPPDDGIVYAADLRGWKDTDRWPSFAPQAADLGYCSMLSVGLWTGQRRYAALNLYAEGPDAFDRDDRLVAALFGVQAATLLYGAESAAGLDRALASRDVIGQAKGILMERNNVGADAAFALLVEASQETNMKLTLVAEWVVGEVSERERTPAGRPSRSAHHVRGPHD